MESGDKLNGHQWGDHQWDGRMERCVECDADRSEFMRGRKQNPFTFRLDMIREYACPDFEVSFDKQGKCLYYIDVSEHECGLCNRSDRYRCIQDLRCRPLPLSHSAVQDFLTCHHYYYLTQILGIEVVPSALSDPIKEGALWNAALDWHLSGGKSPSPAITVAEYSIQPRSVLKIKAMIRAWKDLEIAIPEGFELQKRFDHIHPVNFYWLHEQDIGQTNVNIRGYYDRWYPEHFVECKLTGKPDRYMDIFFVSSQIGTYFLADQNAEYVIMEIMRNPDLRPLKDETDDSYAGRVYAELMTQPGRYFVGWNRRDSTFGKKFLRVEFNLREIEARFEHIVREIYTCLEFKGFYKNDRACSGILPGVVCPFLNLCRYNVASENVYRIKEKKL